MARRTFLRYSRQPTQAAAAGQGPEVTLQAANLRAVLDAAKAFSPALARELRRNLRGTGAGIIAEQRSILDGPLPSGIQQSGTRLRLVGGKGGRKTYVRKVNTYSDRDVNTERRHGTGMREAIKKSLVTRVVAGKSRQGVAVRAQVRVGGVMAVQWQARRFRHPVFQRPKHTARVDQKGQPYFWGPVVAGQDDARVKIRVAIDEALDQIP